MTARSTPVNDHLTLIDSLVAARDIDHGIKFIVGANLEQDLSYLDLYRRALNYLSRFQEHGLQLGDQLILLTNDYPLFITAFWAAVLGGIIPIPVAVGINDQQRSKVFQIFATLERGHVLTSSETIARLQQYATEHDADDLLERILAKTVMTDMLSSTNYKIDATTHAADPDDVAFIQFSSGSTSEPKGVVLTHRNILTNLSAISAGAAYTPDDISLSWMPLTHDMGLIGFHLNMLACGMHQCLMTTDLFSRRPLLWLSKATEHRTSVLCSPNFGLKHYLKALGDKAPENVDLASVRLIYNGAEPISISLCEQFLQTLQPYGLRRNTMFPVYGLAEATLAVAFPPLGTEYRSIYIDRHQIKSGDPVRYVAPDAPNSAGFVIEGHPVKNCEIRITDQNNKLLASDTIGEIQIRGPAVTQGYYRNEAANQNAFSGAGWLNTGDQGFLTREGELVVTGRSKDIIFANGQNYYPHDIELLAQELPGIELGKVIAYGVRQPDADSDELLIFVLFRRSIDGFADTARRIKHHINEKMGLEVSHVLPVGRIPKTTSGKLQRRSLGDAYLQGEFREAISILAQGESSVGNDLQLRVPLEQELLAIVKEVVKENGVSITDNLFDLGISSVTLAEIHEHIDQRYPHLTEITDLFEHQTLRELADFLNKKIAEQSRT